MKFDLEGISSYDIIHKIVSEYFEAKRYISYLVTHNIRLNVRTNISIQMLQIFGELTNEIKS